MPQVSATGRLWANGPPHWLTAPLVSMDGILAPDGRATIWRVKAPRVAAVAISTSTANGRQISHSETTHRNISRHSWTLTWNKPKVSSFGISKPSSLLSGIYSDSLSGDYFPRWVRGSPYLILKARFWTVDETQFLTVMTSLSDTRWVTEPT